MIRQTLALSLSALAVMSSPVCATPVTSIPSGLEITTVTFAAYDGLTGNAGITTLSGPVDLGQGVTLTAENNGGGAIILGAVDQNFGNGSSWPRNGAYAGLNGLNGSLVFTFDHAVNFVGGFLNFIRGDSNATISAIAEDGGAIEDTDLVFQSTVSGEYFGFQHDVANIWGLRISSAFVSIDDLSFGTPPTGTSIPEPATTALALAALGALAFTRRRA